MPTKLLIPREEYLAAGLHIGMKQRTADMKEFIYNIRDDGLAVLNLSKVDERIRLAAKFLARGKYVLIVGRKMAAQESVKKFAEVIDAKSSTGRFLPGTLTNPQFKNYYEADIVLVSDPLIDYQALKETVTARIPVIGICDTFNETRNIDLIIPANNKGKKALATLFWLLTREVLKERGTIKSDEEFKYKITDFGKEE
ncbi:MAG: 30S ribosomal protein S2 [Candidatus Aenigmarchaeota archaeon]|nr:30S ribosomal protein S2 [Candidatus Aenigmarchaeota archaeon]